MKLTSYDHDHGMGGGGKRGGEPQASSEELLGAKSIVQDSKFVIHYCWKTLEKHPKMEIWKIIFLFNCVILRFQPLIFQGVFIPLSLYFGVLQGFDVGGAVWLDDEAGDGWGLRWKH